MILAFIATAFAAEANLTLSVPHSEIAALCSNEQLKTLGTFTSGLTAQMYF